MNNLKTPTQRQPGSISAPQRANKGVRSGLTPFQPSEETIALQKALGGKEWYDRAKRMCCNFDIREREGYCTYLFEPAIRHTKSCPQCELGQGLLRYEHKRLEAKGKKR